MAAKAVAERPSKKGYRMEVETVWVPLETNFKFKHICRVHPHGNEKTKEAKAKVKTMVADGWHIVSIVPLIGSASSSTRGLKDEGSGHSLTYTTGYVVWLERH